MRHLTTALISASLLAGGIAAAATPEAPAAIAAAVADPARPSADTARDAVRKPG